MSDNNIIRPAQWLANAESSLAAPPAEPLPRDAPIVGGGGPPHDPSMEARMTAVENEVRDIRGTLQRIESLLGKLDERMRKVELDLSELKGRVSQLPTTFQMLGFVVAIFVASGLVRHLFP